MSAVAARSTHRHALAIPSLATRYTLLLALPAVIALAVRVLAGPHTIDDAYITFRYARNLAEGQGLVYNPGEWVLGTTAPLWAIVLAAGYRLGATNLPMLATVVAALCDAATAVLLSRLAMRLGFNAPGAALVGLAWAVNPMSLAYATGGMETSVFILVALMALTLAATAQSRPMADGWTSPSAGAAADEPVEHASAPVADGESAVRAWTPAAAVSQEAHAPLGGARPQAPQGGRISNALSHRLAAPQWANARLTLAAALAGCSVALRPEGALVLAAVIGAAWLSAVREAQPRRPLLARGEVAPGRLAAALGRLPVALGRLPVALGRLPVALGRLPAALGRLPGLPRELVSAGLPGLSRELVWAGLAGLLPIAVLAAALTLTYGSPLPNSVTAKALAYAKVGPFDNALALAVHAGLPGWSTFMLAALPPGVGFVVACCGLATLIVLVWLAYHRGVMGTVTPDAKSVMGVSQNASARPKSVMWASQNAAAWTHRVMAGTPGVTPARQSVTAARRSVTAEAQTVMAGTPTVTPARQSVTPARQSVTAGEKSVMGSVTPAGVTPPRGETAASEIHWQPFALFTALYILFYVAVGPRGVRLFPWYLVPLVPLYLLAAAAGLRRLGGAPWLAGLLLLWQLPAVDWHQAPLPLGQTFSREQALLQIGEELGPNELIAAPEIGALGYASNARILDTTGLVSPGALPYYPLPTEEVVGDNAIPPALILDQRPALVVTFDAFVQRSLLADPVFQQSYRLERAIEAPVWQSQRLLVFRRVERAAREAP